MKTDIKILMSDDSAFMRKVLKDILQGAGFTNFIEASNGKEAIEKYRAEKPDLILLDVVMPELDGVGVTKEIGKEATIIMVSAVGQDSVIKEATDNGAKGYIVKPFDKTKVLEMIEKVIG